MQNLTRRTALTGVALLAGVAAPTALAATAAGGTNLPDTGHNQTAVSAPLAALVAEYRWCKAEWHRLSDKTGEQGEVVQKLGVQNPFQYMAHSRPAEKRDREWAADCERYEAEYKARPEVVRLQELADDETSVWERRSEIADEVSVLRAETFADLQAQLDIWFDYYCERNIDGSLDCVSSMGGPELRFLVRLPSEIARLAGAS